ncbi:MAG: ABC transporter ATP-binding protein [Clostridiaceae bacterium]
MRITDLEKKIGDFTLRISSLNLEEGAIHGFVGGNGCGKTTLAKLIMGILPKDSGLIDCGDLMVTDMTMTSQRPYLLHTSVYENIVYPLRIRKRKIDEKEVDELLKLCGLLGKKEQHAKSLSSGERQKVSLIRALIFSPKFVIIDETLSNLDMESAELFEKMILDMQRENPKTFILISHQLPHLYKMCDHVHFFSDGRLVESGTAEDVFLKSKNEIVRNYMRTQMIEMRGND